MNITLRNINENNWKKCIHLKVSEDQERFVATNENGLALAYAHKEMNPRAIYNDDNMVGFIMYARDPDDGFYYINRFMIDSKYQRKGYGRVAMQLILEQLKTEGVTTLDILHRPDNKVAIKLYQSFGFELTEDIVDKDVVSRVKLNSV